MEEELDEIEEGKIDWRQAMADFYERFDKDLKHAEEHMTDIKRMEKPTDLICEKCGKPLVIKWGKHGSFIACSGYPEFSSKSAEADLKKVENEITRQRERAHHKVAKIQAKYPEMAIRYEHEKFVIDPHWPKTITGVLKRAAKNFARQRAIDRKTIEARLEKIQARY